jgi:hypothetical protein
MEQRSTGGPEPPLRGVETMIARGDEQGDGNDAQGKRARASEAEAGMRYVPAAVIAGSVRGAEAGVRPKGSRAFGSLVECQGAAVLRSLPANPRPTRPLGSPQPRRLPASDPRRELHKKIIPPPDPLCNSRAAHTREIA